VTLRSFRNGRPPSIRERIAAGEEENPPICQECGGGLTRQHVNSPMLGDWTQLYRWGARFCSNACRQKAYRRRRRDSE
jgi:hypothetical protein